MGFFGKKDTEDTVVSTDQVVRVAKAGSRVVKNSMSGIVKPRITEKTAILGEKNVYTFEIKKGTTKFEVRDAIKALYNVTSVRVNIVNKQPRHSMSRSRGRDMMESGLRKAYVFLKKGDRIELV